MSERSVLIQTLTKGGKLTRWLTGVLFSDCRPEDDPGGTTVSLNLLYSQCLTAVRGFPRS